MNKLSLLSLLGMLCVAPALFSQSNTLTKAEFFKVKFNGLSYAQLNKAKANEDEIFKLLDAPIRVLQGDGGIGDDWKNYEFSHGLTIGYIDTRSDDYAPCIYYINASAITIDGIAARVGDSATVFEDKFTVTENGTVKYIDFIVNEETCCPLTITINTDDNTIAQIEYKMESVQFGEKMAGK